MSVEIQDLQSIVEEISSSHGDITIINDDLETRIQANQNELSQMAQDLQDCCFEQQDEIDKLTEINNKQKLNNATNLIDDIKDLVNKQNNEYEQIVKDDFMQSGQLSNCFEKVSLFMLEIQQKTQFINTEQEPEPEPNTTDLNGSTIKSPAARRSILKIKAKLNEIKDKSVGKDEIVKIFEDASVKMALKHDKQIENLHQTNDDAFKKMRGLIVELNKYKTQHGITSSSENDRFQPIPIFLTWAISMGLFAAYHYNAINQYQKEQEIIYEKCNNTSYSWIPQILGLIIFIGLIALLLKFVVKVIKKVPVVWNGIKWFFRMILPKHIYVLTFEDGDQKKWQRKKKGGRLSSYEEKKVNVKKIRVL